MLKRIAGLLLSVIATVAVAYPDTFAKTAQIIQLFDSNPNAVWNDFNFNSTPIIVHNGTPELMAFYFKPDNANWVPVPDLAFFGWYSIVDENQLHKMKFHPHYPINNTFAYVFGFNPSEENQDRAYQAFVHEKFHVFQGEHFKHFFVPGLAYQDHVNEINQQLLFIENKALMALLQDLSSIERMKDVIAVYEIRRKHLQENSRLWENVQIRLEGMAEYVDTITFITLPILENNPFSLLSYTSERNFGWLEEKPVNFVDSAIKWRHYSVGAISGLALDALNVDWKQSVQAGASPMDMLAEYLSMSEAEMLDRYHLVHNKWFDPAQAEKISYDIREYKDVLSAIRQKYNQSPGTEVHWPFSCASGGLTENSYFLAEGGIIDLVSSTRVICEQDGARFTLEMKRHPVVYSDSLKGLRFKVDAPIIVNGRPLDTETPNNGQLHRLYFKSDTITLDYEGNTCFAWDGESLKVESLMAGACPLSKISSFY